MSTTILTCRGQSPQPDRVVPTLAQARSFLRRRPAMRFVNAPRCPEFKRHYSIITPGALFA